jgi:hypothetical protein
LLYNERALRKTDNPNDLTEEERIALSQAVEVKKKEYKQMADNKFDNNKNWSTMINKEDNNIRNEIMRRVKSKQIKDRCLHDFIRTYRKDVVNERIAKTVAFQEDVTVASSNGN